MEEAKTDYSHVKNSNHLMTQLLPFMSNSTEKFPEPSGSSKLKTFCVLILLT